jgi:outer membrane protein assembly factor BamB
VVGDLDGVIHLLDPASGKLVGRAKTSGEVQSLRVIDNQLYVATRKGALSIWQNR